MCLKKFLKKKKKKKLLHLHLNFVPYHLEYFFLFEIYVVENSVIFQKLAKLAMKIHPPQFWVEKWQNFVEWVFFFFFLGLKQSEIVLSIINRK
jgi:hypothetical protein